MNNLYHTHYSYVIFHLAWKKSTLQLETTSVAQWAKSPEQDNNTSCGSFAPTTVDRCFVEKRINLSRKYSECSLVVSVCPISYPVGLSRCFIIQMHTCLLGVLIFESIFLRV